MDMTCRLRKAEIDAMRWNCHELQLVDMDILIAWGFNPSYFDVLG
jgi:hypothetical protein